MVVQKTNNIYTCSGTMEDSTFLYSDEKTLKLEIPAKSTLFLGLGMNVRLLDVDSVQIEYYNKTKVIYSNENADPDADICFIRYTRFYDIN